jgi:hypothetical protein
MKLYGVRILFVLGLVGVLGNFAEVAGVGEIALYRGADRQARLEKGAKAEGEFVCTLRSMLRTYSESSTL